MGISENGKIDNEGGYSSKVLVVGDVILDRYVTGRATRISPEAPVPVLCEKTVEYRAGGAANVALNCQAVGVSTTLMGITGRDSESSILSDQVMALDGVHFHKEEGIPTTLKTRYIADGHQMLRVDRERIDSGLASQSFLKYVLARLKTHSDPVIISDYGKHITNSIPNIILTARRGSQVFVDPKNSNWNIYRKATTITPNLAEYEKAGGDVNNLSRGCRFLRNKYEIESILLTMGGEGMFFSSDQEEFQIPAVKSEMVDVTGCGDTAIAVFVSSIAKGFGIEASLEIANSMAGLACQKVGTAVAG